MRYLLTFFALLAVFFNGCASVSQSSRVNSDIRASQFNSVALDYMERPTAIFVERMSDGETVLLIRMATYGNRGLYGSELRIARKHVSECVAAIEKYLEWATLARERRELLTKEIAQPVTCRIGLVDWSLKFVFRSSTVQKHYLSIAASATGVTFEDLAHYYNEDNALRLKTLLAAFESDTLRLTAEAIYK